MSEFTLCGDRVLSLLRSLCFNDCNNYFSFFEKPRDGLSVNCWELKVLCVGSVFCLIEFFKTLCHFSQDYVYHTKDVRFVLVIFLVGIFMYIDGRRDGVIHAHFLIFSDARGRKFFLVIVIPPGARSAFN
jgi:hypothetical protein